MDGWIVRGGGFIAEREEERDLDRERDSVSNQGRLPWRVALFPKGVRRPSVWALSLLAMHLKMEGGFPTFPFLIRLITSLLSPLFGAKWSPSHPRHRRERRAPCLFALRHDFPLTDLRTAAERLLSSQFLVLNDFAALIRDGRRRRRRRRAGQPLNQVRKPWAEE